MDIAIWVDPLMLGRECAFLRHLIMGLKSEGQQVTFIAPQGTDLSQFPVLGSRVLTYRWNRWERLPVLQKLRLNQVARALNDSPPDVLLAWGTADAGLLATFAQMTPLLPMVVWCWDAAELFTPLLRIPTVRQAIVSSETLASRITGNFPVPVTVIRPGVYSEDLTACFDVPGQLACLVSLDPLSDLKAYECLLRGCRMIVDAGEEFMLFAYDTGREEYNIWQLAEQLNLLDRLSFVPFHQDAEPLLLHGDLYIHVLPSSRVQYRTLEAMARGLAVVTCANHGADYLRDNETARIVGPQTPEAWRDALLELLTDRNKAIALAKRGQQLMKDRHTLGRTLEQFGSICRQAAGVAIPLRA